MKNIICSFIVTLICIGCSSNNCGSVILLTANKGIQFNNHEVFLESTNFEYFVKNKLVMDKPESQIVTWDGYTTTGNDTGGVYYKITLDQGDLEFLFTNANDSSEFQLQSARVNLTNNCCVNMLGKIISAENNNIENIFEHYRKNNSHISKTSFASDSLNISIYITKEKEGMFLNIY